MLAGTLRFLWADQPLAFRHRFSSTGPLGVYLGPLVGLLQSSDRHSRSALSPTLAPRRFASPSRRAVRTEPARRLRSWTQACSLRPAEVRDGVAPSDGR